MLNDENLRFPASSVSSSGKNFVRMLSDLLWYIDGHQGTITKQGFPIPNCFLKFEGYNIPEMAKHRKRQHSNLSADVLNSLSSSLFLNLQASFWAALPWQHLKRKMELIASSVSSYAVYLSSQSKKMGEAHHQTTPVRQLSNSLSIKYLKPCRQNTMFEAVSESLASKGYYECLFLNDFLPSDVRKRYSFIQCLEKSGLAYPIILLTHSSGNVMGNLNFVWKVEADVSIECCFQSSQKVVEQLKPQLPQFHTRAMRRALFTKYGRVTSGVKPAVLRSFYKDLTGDSSAPHDTHEAKVDARVQEILNMEPEDPTTVLDLREVKSQVSRTKFEVFWEEARKYINESLGTVVDDRRHNNVTHLAKAISV